MKITIVRTDDGLEVRRISQPSVRMLEFHAFVASLSVLIAYEAVRRFGPDSGRTFGVEVTCAGACFTFFVWWLRRMLVQPDTIVVDPADPNRYSSRRFGMVPIRDLRRRAYSRL
ncbi:MAG TPA: hypothetical protein VFO25_02130 [Candidatus Eremiobacteraceae bacterium]|nr:hypothetical protein [Candidatus Eremiobacteraceae bacterium]